MSKTNDEMDVQVAIERMIRDTVHVRCSKVLLSPDMYYGCLDRIVARVKAICVIGPALTSEVFVRGVPVEKCDSLSGTEYALVPTECRSTGPEDTVRKTLRELDALCEIDEGASLELLEQLKSIRVREAMEQTNG